MHDVSIYGKQTVIEEKKNSVICIIDMHRSGTSMVTRLLNLSGLDLGSSEQLYEPDDSNPLGYYENKGFHKIDFALLAHFGGTWDNPPLLEEGWEYDSSLEQIIHKSRLLIESFLCKPLH